MGTSGVHKFHFTSDSAQASHFAWEHLDYDHTTDAFLLDCAFTHHGKFLQVVELPLPREPGFTNYHNFWIAFHVLAIWYILAKGVYHIIPLIKEMFYDLELEEECADILDKFPWITSDIDVFWAKNKINNIQMGTKVLGKGKKSKSSTTASQSNCSSISPLNPIREDGEIVDMEEQMPELVDNTDDDDSGTSGDQ